MSRLALLVLSGLALAALAQQPLVEKEFSWVPPAGFSVHKYANLHYHSVGGPQQTQIQISRRKFPGPMTAFADAQQKELTLQIPGVKWKRTPFKTASGVEGVRLRASSQQKVAMLQYFYLFPGPGEMKLIVFCSGPAAAKGNEALFDKAMRTFTRR